MKIPKEVLGIVILWATWLSSSIIFLMVKVAVLEDRLPARTAQIEGVRSIWSMPQLIRVPELVELKRKSQ